MSRPSLIAAATALVVATMPVVPAQAQNWSARAAESQCRDQLRRQYQVSNTHSVTTSDRGNGRFQVNGNADRDRQTASFNCRVEYGNVRNLNVGRWNDRSNNGGGDAFCAGFIAGVFAEGGVSIAAIERGHAAARKQCLKFYSSVKIGGLYSVGACLLCLLD